MPGRRTRRALGAVVVLLGPVVALQSPAARATFPGFNGKLACWGITGTGAVAQVDVWTVNPDGSDHRNLTNTQFPVDEQDPQFTPDGRQIIFASDRPTGNDPRELFTMNHDGSNIQQLSFNGDIVDIPRTFNPQGTRIVAQVSGGDHSDFEVYTMNPDGTGRVNLTRSPTSDGLPDWSPDGSRIAFNSNRRGGDFDIWRMDPNGGSLFNVTSTPGEDSGPRWSPDGQKIVYQRNEGGNFDIYTINADGTGRKRLTSDPIFEAFPIWSPDGTTIAFSRAPGAAAEIWTMDAETGGNQRQITNRPGFDGRCDWQRLGPGGQLCTIAGLGVLRGTEGDDVICGSAAVDYVQGLGGDDAIVTGAGNDTVQGGDGNDVIYGSEGDDNLQGQQGADQIFGGPGNDRITADASDSVVDGGPGTNLCTGGLAPGVCAPASG